MMFRLSSRLLSISANRLSVSSPVSTALQNGAPIVALESTVITHGMPYPENLRCAQKLEEVVRKEGAVPATIAILNGQIQVGMDTNQLEQLALHDRPLKVSTRDIPAALTRKRTGGTTVAATMRLAKAADISIFATGGVGGVHRQADQSWDVSGDLSELSRTSVTVVCAGVKSILDVPKTLEYLETQSVPVVVFGASNEFPGFFTRHTGCKVSFATTDINELVDIIEYCRELGLTSRPLIACPIPEEYEAVGSEIETAIQNALHEVLQNKIRSQDVTPFLLKRVNELTQGKSLIANMALLENNAQIGASLAVALSKRRMNTRGRTSYVHSNHVDGSDHPSPINQTSDITVTGPRPVVVSR